MFKYHDTSNMSHAKYWAVLALVVLGILVYFVWYTSTDVLVDARAEVRVKEVAALTFTDAGTLMNESAKKWQPNAVLSKITSLGVANAVGNTESWQAIFVSISRDGFGYVVQADVQGITHEEEVPYHAGGAPFPVGGKTQVEAIKEVRAIPRRENVVITGVEAIYNEADGVWYWGIKTEGGVISVKIQ